MNSDTEMSETQMKAEIERILQEDGSEEEKNENFRRQFYTSTQDARANWVRGRMGVFSDSDSCSPIPRSNPRVARVVSSGSSEDEDVGSRGSDVGGVDGGATDVFGDIEEAGDEEVLVAAAEAAEALEEGWCGGDDAVAGASARPENDGGASAAKRLRFAEPVVREGRAENQGAARAEAEPQPGCSRWGLETAEDVDRVVQGVVPRSTRYGRESRWRAFQEYLAERNIAITAETTKVELADIMRVYVFRMRKRDGEDYKEQTLKQHFNCTLRQVQEHVYREFGMVVNPNTDLKFRAVRKARDAKRKVLQRRPDKQMTSSKAFSIGDYDKMCECYDPDTPDGLNRRFFLVAAKELAWRGQK